LPVLQARLKSGAPFLSYSQKVFFQKKQISKEYVFFADENVFDVIKFWGVKFLTRSVALYFQ